MKTTTQNSASKGGKKGDGRLRASLYAPHPLIRELLDIPIYTGTRTSLAAHLNIANSTMSAPNGLTIRIRKRLLRFIDERLDALDETKRSLVDLRARVACINGIGQVKE